jgi:hypothetical protein
MSKSSIKVKKIKYSEGAGKISIDYSRIRDEHYDELSLLSDEAAAPEFYAALEALILPVCSILEFDSAKFKQRIKPYGITFHYNKDDAMSAIISVKLEMPETGMQVAINTPMLKSYEDMEEAGPCLSETATKLIWKAEIEARKYIAGKRAQTTLFDETGNVAEAAPSNEEDTSELLTGDVPLTGGVAAAAQIIDFPQNAAQ